MSSILSAVMCWNFVGFIISAAAMIIALIARSQIKNSGGAGIGMANWALGISIVTLIVSFVLGILPLLAIIGINVFGDNIRDSMGMNPDALQGK